MKYWQKTFLATLLLFLAALNTGAYLLWQSASRSSLDAERERGFLENGFIADGIASDLASLAARNGSVSTDTLDALYRGYAEYYYPRGIALAIVLPDGSAYSNLPDRAYPAASPDPGEQFAEIRDTAGVPYLYVTSWISGAGYRMVTARSIASTVSRTKLLGIVLVHVNIGVTLLLTAALFLILRALTQPIRTLSAAASAFSSGDLEARAQISGHDELAGLAASFNRLADEVSLQMDALTAAAEQKQRFIDDLAHEMRTPLTAIAGYAEYLAGAAATEDERLSALDYMEKESRRLAELSEKLLLLARLRSDLPDREPVRPHTLLDDIARTVCVLAKDRNVTVSVLPTDAVWHTDELLLHQLVLNLAQNAVRACSTDGHVYLLADERCINVRDDGCGIPENAIARITEPFFRVDRARSRSQGGAGLGLSIAARIAALLDFTLSFVSAPGEGTQASVSRQPEKDLQPDRNGITTS